MKLRIELHITLAAIALLIPGCASDLKLSSRDRAAIHRVAVDHAMSITGEEPRGAGSRVAGNVLQQGASYGLGFLGLGLAGGLAMGAADLAQPSKNGEISAMALRILAEAHTEPGALLAVRMERELARSGFIVDSKAPDAAFHFELEKLAMVPADDLKLRRRPELGVRATLIGGKGNIVWRRRASAVSATALTWQDYSSQPRRLRADFEQLAARIATELVAEIKR